MESSDVTYIGTLDHMSGQWIWSNQLIYKDHLKLITVTDCVAFFFFQENISSSCTNFVQQGSSP